MTTTFNIERTLNHCENMLSAIAYYPVAGTVISLPVRISLGLIQAITAVACAILVFIPSIVIKDWSYLASSWEHIKHGGGNLLAAILEGIPLGGFCIYFLRAYGQEAPDYPVHINNGHQEKFMPYKSLVEKDWFFAGEKKQDIDTVQALFGQKLNQVSNPISLTFKEKMKIAQEAIVGTFAQKNAIFQ